MSFPALLAIAVALAMDAFAVSLATGLQLRLVSLGQTMRMAGAFGFFQWLMPVVGWFLGSGAQRYIEAYDHWVAFALLLFVGCHMIWEAKKAATGGQDAICQGPDPTRGKSILLLGLATSLDALAVGLSLALLDLAVWFPALVIGLVCFVLSAAGMHLGRLVCRLPGLSNLGAKANVLGGLVLIAVGLKILQEHGVFQ